MHNYLFDVKLFTALRINADSEADARTKLKELLDCATINVGTAEDGEPITGEASLDVDGEFDLMEVNGEAV